MSDFSAVERACGYTFKDKRLLKRALTLSSYDPQNNNESLECLGDALLSFIVAEKYFYKGYKEGEITHQKQLFLSDDALRPVSEGLGLDKALLHDKGDSGNKKSVPSAYEALVAAIYLDGGLDSARRFALSTLTPLKGEVNYVGRLQELLQSRGESLPIYEKKCEGTAQSPHHTVKVTVGGKSFRAVAQTLAEAKREAARLALEYFFGEGR